MPAFLRDLRRRSKSSFNRQKSDGTDSSTSNSNNDNGNGNNSVPSMPTTKSSSTLNSSYGGATPPMSNSQSSSNLQTLNGIAPPPPIPPTRPPISSSLGNRHSVSGMSGLGSPSLKSSIPPSPYAPRILSIADNTWVGSEILGRETCS